MFNYFVFIFKDNFFNIIIILLLLHYYFIIVKAKHECLNVLSYNVQHMEMSFGFLSVPGNGNITPIILNITRVTTDFSSI